MSSRIDRRQRRLGLRMRAWLRCPQLGLARSAPDRSTCSAGSWVLLRSSRLAAHHLLVRLRRPDHVVLALRVGRAPVDARLTFASSYAAARRVLQLFLQISDHILGRERDREPAIVELRPPARPAIW